MTSAQKLMVYQTRLGCHHPISRIRKWDPRSGKGGILLPPNLLVLLLAQMRPGRFPLPRACSMTVSEEARNEEVKSSHFRRERSRTRAAGRPGSQAPLHPRSRPRFCSDPPHPNPLPSEDLTVPFLPPSTPGRPRAPQLTVEGHHSPCHACQRSANIRLLCLTGNRPLPVPSLPSHFRHTSNPLPTCHRVPKGPARELRPFRTCLRRCPPGGGTVSLSDWSLPGEASRTISSSSQDTQIPGRTSGILSSYCSGQRLASPSTPKPPVLCTHEV